MPFENSPAAAAPTRRSSRPRTEPVQAIAAEAADVVVDDAREVSEAPLSRRAARQRLSTAEIFVAASAVAAASAASDHQAVVPAEDGAAVETAAEPSIVSESTVQTDAPAADAPAADAPADEPRVDAFESAARAFRTAAPEAESAQAPEADAAPSAVPAEATQHVGRRRPPVRRFLAVGATVGVMSLAGLLAVGMTLPAEAVAAVQGGQALSSSSLVAASGSGASDDDDEIQAFVTSSDVQNESLARSDSFSTVSMIQVASEEGINYSDEIFTNDPEAAIQWPFKVGVNMSSGYGMRWGRLHEGTDFVPGEGAPIQAIADGTVRIATEQGGAYGVTVYIDHVIDGQVVTSHYSHMQYGSLQVKTGDTVKVGDIIGRTGNTGRSYGAHLHLELIINGSKIDPLPWLRENAGRYSY